MKSCFVLITLFATVLAQAGDKKPINECKHDENTFRCVELVRVIDGDSVVVNISNIHPLLGKEVTIRIANLDAPEKNPSLDKPEKQRKCEKAKAKEAKYLIESILKKATRIDVVNVKRPKYFRILGSLLVDNQNIGDLLLQSKLAIPYDGQKKAEVDWCKVPDRLPASKSKTN